MLTACLDSLLPLSHTNDQQQHSEPQQEAYEGSDLMRPLLPAAASQQWPECCQLARAGQLGQRQPVLSSWRQPAARGRPQSAAAVQQPAPGCQKGVTGLELLQVISSGTQIHCKDSLTMQSCILLSEGVLRLGHGAC